LSIFFPYYRIFLDIGGVVTCFGVNLDLNFFCLFFFYIVLYFSFTVFKYSSYYIEGDNYESRFNIIFIIFVGAIIFFLISPDLFFLILGWEILGISSYLLVSHYQRAYSLHRSRITILVNRLGDRCLMFRICSLAPFFLLGNMGCVGYACYLLIMTSFSKRAQLPFSVWLPAAIAAPTPVSSLVHSSTLVTAGLYLYIECYFYFDNYTRFIVLIFRLCTTLFSSLSACFEFNLKKIIALSTTRQISIIFFMLSLNYVNFAFFHLVVHARFKCTLFIVVGIGLHNLYGQLDRRILSYSWLNRPFLVCLLVLCNLCLIGFPFSSSFYSKDRGFEFGLGGFYNIYRLIRFLLFLSILLSCIYSFKVISNFLPYFLSSSLISGPVIRKFLIRILLPMLAFVIFFGYIYFTIILNVPFYTSFNLFLKISILIVVILPFVIRRSYFRKFISGYFVVSLSLINFSLVNKFYSLVKFCISSSFYIRNKLGIFISSINPSIDSLKFLDFGLVNHSIGGGGFIFLRSYFSKFINTNMVIMTSLFSFLFYILGLF